MGRKQIEFATFFAYLHERPTVSASIIILYPACAHNL